MYIYKRKFGNDPEFQDKVLLNYAKRTTGIIGMGRVHSFSDDEDSRSDASDLFNSIDEKEEIATFGLFYDSDYPEHGLFNFPNEVKSLIDMISRVVDKKRWFNDEIFIRDGTYIRLISLRDTLKKYEEFLLEKRANL